MRALLLKIPWRHRAPDDTSADDVPSLSYSSQAKSWSDFVADSKLERLLEFLCFKPNNGVGGRTGAT